MRGGLRDIGRGCLLGGRINLRTRRNKLGGGFINHHAGLMPADVERVASTPRICPEIFLYRLACRA